MWSDIGVGDMHMVRDRGGWVGCGIVIRGCCAGRPQVREG